MCYSCILKKQTKPNTRPCFVINTPRAVSYNYLHPHRVIAWQRLLLTPESKPSQMQYQDDGEKNVLCFLIKQNIENFMCLVQWHDFVKSEV